MKTTHEKNNKITKLKENIFPLNIINDRTLLRKYRHIFILFPGVQKNLTEVEPQNYYSKVPSLFLIRTAHRF